MADNLIKISELIPTTELKSADIIPISQDGETRSIKGAVLEQNLLDKTDARYIENAQKGAPNGIATLDADSKVPNENLNFGKVEEGNTGIVSGGEVWNYLKTERSQKNNLINDLGSFLCSNTVVMLLGDSITWGMTADNINTTEPRFISLTDTRNNLTSNTWANLLTKCFANTALSKDYTTTESLTNNAQGGVNKFVFEKKKSFFPDSMEFKYTSNSTVGWTKTEYNAGFKFGFAISAIVAKSTDVFNLEFKAKTNNLTLIMSGLVDGADFNVYVDDVLFGNYSNNSSIIGSGFGKKTPLLFADFKEKKIRIEVKYSSATNKSFRLEGFEIDKKVTVINQGIIGVDTHKYLTFLDDALVDNPNYVFIQLGANDRLKYTDRVVDSYQFKSNLGNIIDVIGYEKVILMCSNPVSNETYNFTMQDVRNRIFELSEDKKCSFIDNYTPFTEVFNKTPFMLKDGLHPNEYGHNELFKNIKKNLFNI